MGVPQQLAGLHWKILLKWIMNRGTPILGNHQMMLIFEANSMSMPPGSLRAMVQRLAGFFGDESNPSMKHTRKSRNHFVCLADQMEAFFHLFSGYPRLAPCIRHIRPFHSGLQRGPKRQWGIPYRHRSDVLSPLDKSSVQSCPVPWDDFKTCFVLFCPCFTVVSD